MLKWMLTAFVAALLAPSAVRAQWYAAADFMLLKRHTSSNVVLQRYETAAGRASDVASLSEQDMEFDLTAGGRITVGNRSGMFGVEGSYLGTTEWNETASQFDGSGNLVSPFTQIGAIVSPVFDNNTSVIVDSTSELHTADINLTQNVYIGHNGNVFLLYGARYLSIEESLNYASDNAVADHNLLIATDNRLFGPQLGVGIETPLWGSMLNMSFKSTLGYNSIDKTTNFDGTVGVGSDQDASFISEIGVDCLLVPTNHLSVRLGWYFLAATDVALAADNFERNSAVLASGLANVRAERKVFYHTPYVGLVFAY